MIEKRSTPLFPDAPTYCRNDIVLIGGPPRGPLTLTLYLPARLPFAFQPSLLLRLFRLVHSSIFMSSSRRNSYRPSFLLYLESFVQSGNPNTLHSAIHCSSEKTEIAHHRSSPLHRKNTMGCGPVTVVPIILMISFVYSCIQQQRRKEIAGMPHAGKDQCIAPFRSVPCNRQLQ